MERERRRLRMGMEQARERARDRERSRLINNARILGRIASEQIKLPFQDVEQGAKGKADEEKEKKRLAKIRKLNKERRTLEKIPRMEKTKAERIRFVKVMEGLSRLKRPRKGIVPEPGSKGRGRKRSRFRLK